MQLAPRFGFYIWPDLKYPVLSGRGKFVPWTPGKHLSGYSTSRGFLTSGQDADTFMGFKWVDSFAKNDDHVVVTLDEVVRLFFQVSELEPIFVGRPLTLPSGGTAPMYVALPKAAIHPASIKSVEGKGYTGSTERVLKVLAEVNPPIKVKLTPGGSCLFTADRPLLPSVWKALGYHPVSSREQPTRDVIAHTSRASYFQLPFFHMEDGEEYGIRVITANFCTPTGLDCFRFEITDPERAARLIPALANFAAGAEIKFACGAVSPASDSREFMISAADILQYGLRVKTLSKALPDTRKKGESEPTAEYSVNDGGMFVIPFAAAELARNTLLTVRVGYNVTAYLASVDCLDQFACRKQYIPDPSITGVQPQPRLLFINGVQQEGTYYRKSEAVPRPTATQKRKQRDERFEELTRKYGKLPSYWTQLPKEDQVAEAIHWEKCRSEGWLTPPEFAISLGLSPTHSRLSSWVSKLNIPAVYHPMKSKEHLHPPLSFEEVAALSGFAEHIEVILPDCVGFAMRCGFSETARAALLGKMLGA